MFINMPEKIFTRYEVFVIAILTFLQFTVVLDFMVLSPLGAILMPELKITAAQFGMVVSAYAFSAGASGFLAAGFADKFDRKKLLLFFYGGFIIGTTFCALAQDYNDLLLARIITGIFGGVLSSISFAIITDLFKLQVRGRVMGFVQMAFASSQVLGIPIGLYLANELEWHAPFFMIVGICIIVGIFIIAFLRPIDAHLKLPSTRNAFQHLVKTVSQPLYLRAFAATILLATGGFMLMPFASAFVVNNLGINLNSLPMLYMATGVFSMVTGPLIGRYSDQVGKYNIFIIGSLLTMIVVAVYCNLGTTPFWIVLVLNVLMFVGVSSRIITSSALLTAIPEPQDRGSFMSVNSSIQQVSGGVAAFIASKIVTETSTGKLQHYDTLGYVVVGAMIITIIMMYSIHLYVDKKSRLEVKASPVTQDLKE
jgi:predicted MFS family arabinose efflux permease